VTTRDKLLAAAAEALARDGLSGVSARAIACRAGVNQALVFYHFGSVSDLLEAAVRRSVDLAVASYRDRFADVGSLGELLALGRDLHRMERRRGNVAQMAQVMSGAQRDPILAKAGRYAMQRWTSEIEAVLARLLPGSVVEGLVDPRGAWPGAARHRVTWKTWLVAVPPEPRNPCSRRLSSCSRTEGSVEASTATAPWT
jgi:AcrR family transcriptional regulator